jgi:hypothetical protein
MEGRGPGAEAARPSDRTMTRLAAITAGASSAALARIAELVKAR